MKKILLLLPLLFALMGAEPKESCVRIITSGGSGSGTVIGHMDGFKLVISNAHVLKSVPQNDERYWILVDGKLTKAEKVDINAGRGDLGLLKAKITNPTAIISRREIQKFDILKHNGATSGPQEGRALDPVNFETTHGLVMSSTMLSIPGDSGAGIFNSRGSLCGVNFGRIGDVEQGRQIGVRITDVNEYIKLLVKDWNIKYEEDTTTGATGK